jgi:hypothetical protein
MNDRPRALTVLVSIFLAGCIIGALGFFLWARRTPDFPQVRGGPETFGMARRGSVGGGGPGGQWLPRLLQLTPEQNRRYMQVMEEFRNQLNALRIEQEKTVRYKQLMDEFRRLRTEQERLRTEQEPKIKAIESDTNHKISEILNEEQKKKFAEYVKEFEDWRKRGPRREGGGFGPPGPPAQNPEQKGNPEH